MLGDVRGIVLADIADSPWAADPTSSNSAPAFMFASTDGVCGLAFSARVGQNAAFIGALHGTYPLGGDPLTGEAQGPSAAELAQLAAQADGQTNVQLQIQSGKLGAIPTATIAREPFKLLDRKADCASLQVPNNLGFLSYDLQGTTVSCIWVRTVIWAWVAEQRVPNAYEALPGEPLTPSPHEQILGWNCAGSDLDTRARVYINVTCRDRTNSLSAQWQEPPSGPALLQLEHKLEQTETSERWTPR